MNIKSLSCILLSLLALSACGAETVSTVSDTDATPSSSTAITEEAITEAVRESALAAEDFNGANVSFLAYSTSDYQNSAMDIISEGYDGTIINDAVYNRNARLKEKYNVTFTFKDGGTYSEASSLLKKTVNAGDNSYDVAFLCANEAINLGLAGCLMTVNTLPNLQTTESWWNRKLIDSSSVLGVNYFLIGDMNVDTWSQSYAVYFNKLLAEEYDIPDLYEIVLDGKWTLDVLDTLTRTVYKDINGDGNYDENDLYGLTACSVCIDCFWASADVQFVVADENGMTFQFSDAYYTLWDKMDKLLTAPEMLYTDRPEYTAKRDTYDRGAFLEDRALFFIEGLCVADNRLREMKSDFGILPLPKADESQAEYRTFSHAVHNSTVTFPVTSEERIDMLTKVIEDMAFYSVDTVRPAYYEKLLSGKIARDANSTAMLDIMTQNIVYDRAFLFLSDFTWNMRSQITNSQPASSYAEKNLKQCQKKLDKYTEQVRENLEK